MNLKPKVWVLFGLLCASFPLVLAQQCTWVKFSRLGRWNLYKRWHLVTCIIIHFLPPRGPLISVCSWKPMQKPNTVYTSEFLRVQVYGFIFIWVAGHTRQAINHKGPWKDAALQVPHFSSPFSLQHSRSPGFLLPMTPKLRVYKTGLFLKNACLSSLTVPHYLFSSKHFSR